MTDSFQIPTECECCRKRDDTHTQLWNVSPRADPKQIYFLCLDCIARIGPDGFEDEFSASELAEIEAIVRDSFDLTQTEDGWTRATLKGGA
jgi:hypothetical protein